ncbi:twin-arginine translocation signal domain-containing protein [Anaerophaga thermohalophila]|uniref:twin-arginine translocation signal domain-containing protein n=1 Tax=Anaerophaga thermohalophila TaxID=177400 RepID=UPI0002F487A0|nr:twin-arginine translocation signal domain-containing protein [Anaerophaga thermohalophila]
MESIRYHSRREFLKKLAISGSAATLASMPWLNAFADNNPTRKIHRTGYGLQ